MGSTEFSIMVHDVNLRSKFVRTSIDFLKRNKFDGLGKKNLFFWTLKIEISSNKIIHFP